MKSIKSKRTYFAYRGEYQVQKFLGKFNEHNIKYFICELFDKMDIDNSNQDQEVQEVNEKILLDAETSIRTRNYLYDTTNFTDLYNEYFYLDGDDAIIIKIVY